MFPKRHCSHEYRVAVAVKTYRCVTRYRRRLPSESVLRETTPVITRPFFVTTMDIRKIRGDGGAGVNDVGHRILQVAAIRSGQFRANRVAFAGQLVSRNTRLVEHTLTIRKTGLCNSRKDLVFATIP